MLSAIITITLMTIVTLANAAPALSQQSAAASDHHASPKYYYFYEPQVAPEESAQPQQETRSAEGGAHVAAQSAPVATYQVPPSYFYQPSQSSAEQYQPAESANPPLRYARPPSPKSNQKSLSHRTAAHPKFVAAVQYPGGKPQYYQPYFWA